MSKFTLYIHFTYTVQSKIIIIINIYQYSEDCINISLIYKIVSNYNKKQIITSIYLNNKVQNIQNRNITIFNEIQLNNVIKQNMYKIYILYLI